MQLISTIAIVALLALSIAATADHVPGEWYPLYHDGKRPAASAQFLPNMPTPPATTAVAVAPSTASASAPSDASSYFNPVGEPTATISNMGSMPSTLVTVTATPNATRDNVASAEYDLFTYLLSLRQSPEYTSLKYEIILDQQTRRGDQFRAISAWSASVTSEILASKTNANFLSGLPDNSKVREFYASVYAMETSIAAANGIVLSEKTTGSQNAAVGAKATGMMAMGVVLAGAVGVMVAL